MARPKSELTAVRRIAADISWARTPDRAERTEAARAASPMRVEYWVKRVREEGLVTGEAAILQAAESYYRAHMTRMSLKAAETRRKKQLAKASARQREPHRQRAS